MEIRQDFFVLAFKLIKWPLIDNYLSASSLLSYSDVTGSVVFFSCLLSKLINREDISSTLDTILLVIR